MKNTKILEKIGLVLVVLGTALVVYDQFAKGTKITESSGLFVFAIGLMISSFVGMKNKKEATETPSSKG